MKENVHKLDLCLLLSALPLLLLVRRIQWQGTGCAAALCLFSLGRKALAFWSVSVRLQTRAETREKGIGVDSPPPLPRCDLAEYQKCPDGRTESLHMDMGWDDLLITESLGWCSKPRDPSETPQDILSAARLGRVYSNLATVGGVPGKGSRWNEMSF